MNSVTKLILAWTMYVTPTVHPTARITPLFYCQIQQVKSQEVKLSFEKNARVVGLQVFFFFLYVLFVLLLDSQWRWEKIIYS